MLIASRWHSRTDPRVIYSFCKVFVMLNVRVGSSHEVLVYIGSILILSHSPFHINLYCFGRG